jgi:uroporphyrinogen decarboxylase
MGELTGKERIARVLARKPADRIGLFEEFWDDTLRAWSGHLDEDGAVALPRGRRLDMEKAWPLNFTADVHFKEQIIEETAETVLALDGNGATLRRHKLHASTPEHVRFRCTSEAVWRDAFRPLLQDTGSRLDAADYGKNMRRAERLDSFLLCGSWNVFQLMQNLCGPEALLTAMALEPDWVHDMVDVYAELAIRLHEELFAQCGPPDGIFLMEDLGYKFRPFMSNAMFREFIKPAYARMCSFARGLGLPVLFHSCGFMEPFVPDLIDAGISCLTAMEVKAGMDVTRLFRQFGDRLSFMGGIDTRALCSNDRDTIETELQRVVPALKAGHGFILSSDHSIPDTVAYETYCWFVERGLELGKG